MGGSLPSTPSDCQGAHQRAHTSGESASVRTSRMLKNSLSFRLLKKVQMSRDFAGRRAGYPSARMSTHRNGYPVRGVLSSYVAAPRERNNAADGPFSAACVRRERLDQAGIGLRQREG